jgi:exodeoxyribonuclease VII small subunit
MTSQEIQFEKALARLEKIVEELETGNISLEDALKKYEEGVKLSRACQEKLAQAEKKIEILTKTLSGSLKKEPFVFDESDTGGEDSGAKRKKSGKSLSGESKQENAHDEDLLF